MKKLLLGLALALSINVAWADSNNNNGNDNGPDFGGTGVGYGGVAIANPVSNNTATANSTSHATGGNALALGGSAFSNASNTVKNDNRNDQSQGQLQGQLQGQNQGQSQSTENSNNASQSTNVTVQGSTYEAKRIPVNTAYSPANYPTAPCMGSSSVGGSGALFSFSGGTSWESKECMLLETARSFEQAGYREDALHIRCEGKYAKSAPSCKALKQ